jgi:hypothetical protein
MAKKKEVESDDEGNGAESPREKFLRLAPPRTDQALGRIRLLGNLASPSYEWTPEEAKQIMDVLFDAVHDLKRKFEHASEPKGKRTGFAFTAPKARRGGEASA